MTIALEILLWILAALLTVAGVVGLVFPALPGALLLFAGLVVAAWAEDFVHVGAWTILLLGVLAVLTFLVDFAAGAFGAKRFGASRRSVVGATIGALVGLLFGIVGILVGPFVGAVIGELSMRTGVRAAGRAGVGATVGLALGTAAKLSLGVSMIGVYLVVRFF